MVNAGGSKPRRLYDAGADRCDDTDVREKFRESADVDDPLDSELLVLIR